MKAKTADSLLRILKASALASVVMLLLVFFTTPPSENGKSLRSIIEDKIDFLKTYVEARKGNAAAQNRLGQAYRLGRDISEAAKWFRKAAIQGNAPAQNQLGWMHEKVLGVAQDNAESAKWYRKAADQGFALAQYNLAEIYENGQLVDQDSVEAYKWFTLAASQGFSLPIKSRNKMAMQMTSEQISEGKHRAAEFKAKQSTVAK